MEMKYFVVEIEVMKDGSIARAISEAKEREQAVSQFHQVLASAVITENVESVYCEVKDLYGNVVLKELNIKPQPEPEPTPEPTPESTTDTTDEVTA